MAEVIGALQEALGPEIVLVGEAVPERNRDDWSGLPPTRPLAVLRPRTTEQVVDRLADLPCPPPARGPPGRAHRPLRRGACR